MTEDPKLDELPPGVHVLMSAKMLTLKAGACLEESPPDLAGAALCIDAARAVDQATTGRIDKMLHDMLRQDLTEVQTEYARLARSSASEDEGTTDEDGGSNGSAE